MTGQSAFEYLSRMKEEEREAVRVVWFGHEMTDSLPLFDDEETNRRKREFFQRLSGKEKGEIIENAIYNSGGDFSKAMLAFLDDVDFHFNLELEKRMERHDSHAPAPAPAPATFNDTQTVG